MARLAVLATLLLVATTLNALETTRHVYGSPEENQLSVKQEQKWFTQQLVDHFDPTNRQTWKQRYWIIDEYYKPENGAVFLFICGEYTCQGVPARRQFILQLAKKYNALILTLEHRYYGDSQPFGDLDLTTERLVYLTVDQALEDMAYFIKWVRENPLFKVGLHNKWITIGGSYPGAMSAWFRAKYPHLTVGALASSAVIEAIEDFWQYDDQMYESLYRGSKECAEDARACYEAIEKHLDADNQTAYEFKAQFGAETLTHNEFRYFYGDIFAGFVQVGNRTGLCKLLASGSDTVSRLKLLQAWARENMGPDGYTVASLQNTTKDVNKAARQWNYQVCTDFGWFQTASKDPSRRLRGDKLTAEWFRGFCQQVFGEVYAPNIPLINLRYGGLNIHGTNILSTNGIEDGWRWATLQKNIKGVTALTADCADCSHCVDLNTPNSKDSFSLRYVRERIKIAFGIWLYTAETAKSKRNDWNEQIES